MSAAAMEVDMAARVAGFILRAADRHDTARFYASLGLSTREHEHGGPRHYEVGSQSSGAVVEVYQRSAALIRTQS